MNKSEFELCCLEGQKIHFGIYTAWQIDNGQYYYTDSLNPYEGEDGYYDSLDEFWDDWGLLIEK